MAKILLADDDWEDRGFMADAFGDIGFPDAVLIVENGEKVLEHLESVKDNEQLPSVVVLDLNMPRLDGKNTLKALKTSPKFKQIPVIIFSTSLNEIEKKECLEIGAAAYMIKPRKYSEYLNIARLLYEYNTVSS